MQTIVVVVLCVLAAIVAFAIAGLVGVARRRRAPGALASGSDHGAIASMVAVQAASIDASSATQVDCASSASLC